MDEYNASPTIPSRLTVSDEFGYWLSGLFDGEGCFLFQNTVHGKTTIALKIKIALRNDDRDVIDYIYKHLGCGSIYANEYRAENYKAHRPWVELRVQKIADLAEVIVPLFDHYPLHTKKAQEFALWRAIVMRRYKSQGRPLSPEEQDAYGEVYEWIAKLRGRCAPPVDEN
jgi:hypothetical protein